MLVRSLILLVLSINVINGLSCIGENRIELSLHDLTPDDFQDAFDELTQYDDDDLDDIATCDILITVDYTTGELTIEFDTTLASVSDSDITDSATLYTTFRRAPDYKQISELTIKCSSEDYCDENFLLNDDHYQWWWLIDEVEHTEVERMFSNLLVDDDKSTGTIHCYDDLGIVDCSAKLCRARDTEQSDLYQWCVFYENEDKYLSIKTDIMTNLEVSQLKHTIDYTCTFDKCNDRSIYLNALNITNMYYNVLPMLRIFSRKPTVELSSTSALTQASSASSTNRPSSTSTSVGPSSSTSTVHPSSTSSTVGPSSSTSTVHPSSTSPPVQSTSEVVPTKSNSTSVLMQSTTQSNAAGNHFKISINIVLLIFQINALLFF